MSRAWGIVNDEQLTIPAVDDHEADLARKESEREARVERERIEWVMGLTGELDDHPWEPWKPYVEDRIGEFAQDHLDGRFNAWDQASERQSFAYTYEELPEWASSDYPDRFDSDVHYRTIVVDCLFGGPPSTLIDGGRVYKLASSYQHSGERECPLADVERDDSDDHEYAVKRPCELCEAQDGEEHGYIYLGEGWCEVVYKCIDPRCEYCNEPIWCAPTEQRFCDAECEHNASNDSEDEQEDNA